VLGDGVTLWYKAEILLDVLGKGIVNLSMTRNGLLLVSHRIDVNVMPSAVPVKSAAVLFKLPNEFCTLHRTISFVS
jgi:hypothetical protein